ncbi:MAG: hypothetical protein J6R86_07520, partial [Lentisphaeria bacterium]|nr:hypothetical protein [Lentisphaeria bacterium]
MSEQEQKINIPASLDALAREMQRRFADYDLANAEDCDRRLVLDAKITEAQLVELYSKAFGVPVLDEEELGLPEQPPQFPLDFFNANDCLVYEWDEGKVTFLVTSPYKLGNLEYLVSRSWKRLFSHRVFNCSHFNRNNAVFHFRCRYMFFARAIA